MAEQQPPQQDQGDPDKFTTDLGGQDVGKYFNFTPGREVPAKDDEEAVQAFSMYVKRIAAMPDLPQRVREMVDGQDWDSLWLLWSEAVA